MGEIYLDMGALGDRGLRRGNKGNDVVELQNGLIQYFEKKGKNALPKFGADGDYGSETETWVKKFQQAVGLSTTGVADKMTQQKLLQMIGGQEALKSTQKSLMPKKGIISKPWFIPALIGVGALAVIGGIIIKRRRMA